MSQAFEETKTLYLEDLHIGQRFRSNSCRMDESRIKAFAAEFDPQPFHLDDMASRGTVFRGLAASGWHTAAVAMRLLVDGGLPLANGIIGLGCELVWSKPTRPGDVIQVESEILEILPSRSRSTEGIVKVRCTTFNQNGDSVLLFTGKLLVSKREGRSISHEVQKGMVHNGEVACIANRAAAP